MTVLAIDPGCTESAYSLVDATTRRPIQVDKLPNEELLELLVYTELGAANHSAIEMVASYGMAVGKEVFETCVWIGRFAQVLDLLDDSVQLVYRRDIKLHHCQSSAAKDANVTQALIDRFASGVRNKGKGTKAEPGYFYGFRADIWQAHALAVYMADTLG